MIEEIEKLFLDSSEVIKKSISLSNHIEKCIKIIVNCFENNNKIILFGNGGSAADAQHIAAEFIGRFKLERDGFPAIALTTDSSIITSLSNDYTYDIVFSRQCESLVSKGDVAIGISTSGRSKNVENGLLIAKEKGATTIGLFGNNGGNLKNLVDISIVVDSTETPRIQEVHRVIYHIICEIVEKKLSERK
jgi:D-sedoheptulose 7-phosphate isomerase